MYPISLGFSLGLVCPPPFFFLALQAPLHHQEPMRSCVFVLLLIYLLIAVSRVPRDLLPPTSPQRGLPLLPFLSAAVFVSSLVFCC